MATDEQSARNKKRFIERFAANGNISRSCRELGIARTSIYEWRADDPEFAAAFSEAEITATELLEEHAVRRAIDGVTRTKPIYHDGVRIGDYTVTEYSDTLLIFMLKARKPDVYRERHDIRHSGDPTAPIAYIEVPGESDSAD